MYKIVFIEDDKFWAKGFITELKKVSKVHHIRFAAEVNDYFEENLDVDAIILDIMMAPPEGQEAAAGEGFWTGVWVLQELREYILSHQVAVYILTNRDTEVVKNRIAEVEDLDGLFRCIDINSKLLAKYATLPGAVIAQIEELRGNEE